MIKNINNSNEYPDNHNWFNGDDDNKDKDRNNRRRILIMIFLQYDENTYSN